jgi:hypothetical protein
VDCAGVPVGEAVRHCYDVTPALSGTDAADLWFKPTTLIVRDGELAKELTIGCTPSVTGTLAATLTVVHNAPGSPAVYPLRCTGEAVDYYGIYLPLVIREND